MTRGSGALTRSRPLPLVLPLAAAALSLTLFGCSPSERLVVYTDPYWLEVLEAGERFWDELSAEARSLGYIPVLREEALESQALLSGAVALRSGDIVLASPFFASQVLRAAEKYGDVLFVIAGVPESFGPEDSLPHNICFLTFDYERVFRVAGREAAGLLAESGRGEGNDPVRGAEGAGAAAKCGILYLDLSEGTSDHVAAFREGFLSGGDAGRLVQREIRDRRDRAQVKRNLEEMEMEGVEVYLLLTHELTVYCLDVLRTLNGRAIIQDWARAPAFPETVIMSVETMYSDGIRDIISAAATRRDTVEADGASAGGGLCPENRYEGRLELVWNEG